jgi:hypothetical protein
MIANIPRTKPLFTEIAKLRLTSAEKLLSLSQGDRLHLSYAVGRQELTAQVL